MKNITWIYLVAVLSGAAGCSKMLTEKPENILATVTFSTLR